MAIMIIRCKIYFRVFYFRGLRKSRKHFYNENFQIYGTLELVQVTLQDEN